MARLGATIKVAMDTSAVKRGLSAMKGMFSRLGGFFRGIFTFPKLLAGGALAAGLIKGTKAATDFAMSLKNMSSQTGLAVGDVLALKQAFKGAGIEIGDDADLISDFQEKLEDALRGGGTAAEGLGMLRMRARDLIDLDPIKQFETLMKAVSNSTLSVQEKAFALDKIFGGQGFKLVPLAENFSEAMGQARIDTKLLAETMEGGLTDSLMEARRSIGLLKLSLTGIGLRLVSLLPVDFIAEKVTKLAKTIEEIFKDPKLLLVKMRDFTIQLGEWLGQGIKKAFFSLGRNKAAIKGGIEGVNLPAMMLKKSGAKEGFENFIRGMFLGPAPKKIGPGSDTKMLDILQKSERHLEKITRMEGARFA